MSLSASATGKSFGTDAIEALATGAAFAAIDVGINKVPANQQLLMVAGQSAASAFGANVIGKSILPNVIQMSSFSMDTVNTFLPPVLSGGIYVAANSVSKLDYRPWMYQFLYQAGSHAAGTYAAGPISRAIMMK